MNEAWNERNCKNLPVLLFCIHWFCIPNPVMPQCVFLELQSQVRPCYSSGSWLLLPTMVAWVQHGSDHVGFVVDKVALGRFLRVLQFPLLIIPWTAPCSSSSIIQGWYNTLNSERCTKWTQSSNPSQTYNLKQVSAATFSIHKQNGKVQVGQCFMYPPKIHHLI
jgi:hypothetical protein